MGPQVLTWNIRGLGAAIKRRLVSVYKLDILMLQETKIKEEQKEIFESVWGDANGCGAMVESIGNSGGLISIWNGDRFKAKFLHKGKNILVLTGRWVDDQRVCIIANVYGPTLVRENEQLWEEIRQMLDQTECPWLIGEDFNVIRNDDERRGRQDSRPEVEGFNTFIDLAELIDFPMVGKKFTWYGPCRRKSRLDRFLASQQWIIQYSNICQMSLMRNVSDHTSVLLSCDEEDWGPRPFRFVNAWLKHPNFLAATEEKWKRIGDGGVVSAKLQGMRKFLRKWNMEVFGNIDNEIRSLEKEVADIESQSGLDEEGQSELEVKRR